MDYKMELFQKEQSEDGVYCVNGKSSYERCETVFNPLTDEYIFKISLNTGDNSILFRPISNGACIITDIVLLSDVGDITIKSSNGEKIGENFLFTKLYPEFVISADNKTTYVEIHCNLIKIEKKLIYSFLKQIENIILENKKECEKLKTESLLLSQNLKIESNTNSLNKKKILELTHGNSILKTSCDDSKKQIESLQRQIQRLRIDRDAISNASFWKMTKPLRILSDCIKKTKHKTNQNNSDVDSVKYKEITSFNELTECFLNATSDQKVYSSHILKKYDQKEGKKILLVSHELALTGAPVAIFYFAQILKEQGYCPVIISPHDGSLAIESEKKEVPVLCTKGLYTDGQIAQYVNLFDLIIANTIVSAPIINLFAGCNIPILWWIHEAETSYKEKTFFEPMPQHLPENVFVYTVGKYAKKMLKKYKPLYQSEDLLYYVSQNISNKEMLRILPENAKDKIVFCIIGLQEYRKGQDILVDAIMHMSEESLKESYFVFVGRKCYQPIYHRIMDAVAFAPENVLYIEELQRNDMQYLYEQIDCLICASRDDPMPIVATEAMQYGKFVICSENTGTAEIIKQEKCGLIFYNNSWVDLSNRIEYVINNKDNLSTFSDNAKNAYEKNFSKEAFYKNTKEIIEKLVSGKKRKNFIFDECSLNINTMINALESEEEECFTLFGEDIVAEYDTNNKQTILLVTHELSLTGAPIVLHSLAKYLQTKEYNILVISPTTGNLEKEYLADYIPVIIYSKLYEGKIIEKYAECFSMIVLNTVVTYRLVYNLQYANIPIVWWIHDSEASYRYGGFENCMIHYVPSNLHIYCAGEYAKDKLLTYYPEYSGNADVLYYCSPDKAELYKNDPVYDLKRKKSGSKLFAVIGQQDSRKGHDILAQAIELLTDEEREKSEFYFIGKHLDENIRQSVESICKKYPDCVHYIEEVEHRKIFSVIKQCDSIICSSKDDPLPVFVTEAFMMSKIVICSENTGSAPIIKNYKCGYVYSNNDPVELMKKIQIVINGISSEEMKLMESAARKAYLNNFSETAFEKNIDRILINYIKKDELFKGIVSVIIPTFNAGEGFENLLKALYAQKNILKLEIVVVDSGSSDCTIDLCKKYGVKLIKISQEEFTHSYARNLGAMNAIGDIFIFMTQDAVPIGEEWAYNMIYPIISGEAAATSAREKNPDNTELFYKISTRGYAKFLKTDSEDQLNMQDGNETKNELRRKASLTDISSAVHGQIFKKFYYRFGYAEDLDLGMRLLAKGYKIKLLNQVRVLHGHNRSVGYYVKRSFVEQMALDKIMLNWVPQIESVESVALKIVSASEALFNTFSDMKAKRVINCLTEEYISTCLEYFNKYLNNKYKFNNASGCKFNDNILDDCLSICRGYCVESFIGDYSILNSLSHYIVNELQTYLEEKGIQFVNVELGEQIKDSITKQMAIFIGIELTKLREDISAFSQFDSYMNGV